MLIVARHSKDWPSFPHARNTIHFIRVQSGYVKIGSDAPHRIAIIRDEINTPKTTASLVRRQFLRLPRDIRFGVRNELPQISDDLPLYCELIQAGQVEEAVVFSAMPSGLHVPDEILFFQSTPNTNSGSSKVFIVEDSLYKRDILADFLRARGYNVDTFANGNEVLNYLKVNRPPKVTRFDMELSECDGLPTVRQIRSDSCIGSTPIFALRGTSPNNLEIGFQGIDRWFAKPLSGRGLIHAIEAIKPQPFSSSIKN
ncbi:response regulator [Bremerella cremea]|uniref:Response regulator n=1 Tax=Bremerella cremea TaxID=1031537 RepID=A0A368KRN2_9BACT|nr:response regulator [Bremerella cremea]RCS46451.1 response regulator [Bremerella cremea]